MAAAKGAPAAAVAMQRFVVLVAMAHAAVVDVMWVQAVAAARSQPLAVAAMVLSAVAMTR